MGSNPSHFQGNDNLPVEKISWYEVQEFIQKLNERTGKRYRLPSEAEWEYAASGGAQSKNKRFAGSNDLDLVGWYKDNSEDHTHVVGQKNSNELGLYDMNGNVEEWCQDVWHKDYVNAPEGGSPWLIGENQHFRVCRGGSWNMFPLHSRVTSRNWNFSNQPHNEVGFRLARDI